MVRHIMTFEKSMHSENRDQNTVSRSLKSRAVMVSRKVCETNLSRAKLMRNREFFFIFFSFFLCVLHIY